uniref:Nucleotidyl transferase AbiEii/AbiGii toxin family protein n=1 Tax=Thermodesulfobacterium geofontis TaxID=1295609 RepID=A0A7V5XFB7_9BACT
MELKVKKLLKEHKEVVEKIFPVLEKGDFYLAGGTALYYYLKHRYSVDLDFFTQKDIDFREFYQNFSSEEIKTISKDTIHAKVKEVNVSFFFYPYPLLKTFLHLNSLKLASLEDILCMKINAIILRGSRKDFIDVYFIMKSLKMKSNEAIKLFVKKFGKYEELVIKKALTYFEDAEKEPEIPIFKKFSWNSIKNFFIKEFAKI